MNDENSCICSRTKCQRHGSCESCRDHHKSLNTPPQCERNTGELRHKKLSDMTQDELWHLFPIRLTAPNPRWAEHYAQMQRRLAELLFDLKPKIHHIGSTAINNIWAKPIVDVLVELDSPESMNTAAELLSADGFLVMSREEKRISLNLGYTEKGFAKKVYHIHLRLPDDKAEICFRDYLNSHPDAAGEYEKLKLGLWKIYEFDRDGYTEAKTEFIQKILMDAKK